MLQPLYQHLPVDGQSLRPVQGRQCPEDQLRVSGSIEGLQCIFCTAKVVLLLQQPEKKGNQPIIGIKGEHPVFGQERGIAGAGMKACVAVVFLQQSQYLGGRLAGSRLLRQLLQSLVKGQQPADSAEPVAQPRYLIAQLCLRKLIIRFEQFPEAGKKRLLLHKKQKIRTERYDALCAEGKSLLYSLQ